MSKTPEEKKDSKLQINKGVELMLQNKKLANQRRPIPKTYQLIQDAYRYERDQRRRKKRS